MSYANRPPHITNYWLMKTSDAETLNKWVENAIHDGWQPFGSLAVDHSAAETCLMQPMVRYAELYR